MTTVVNRGRCQQNANGLCDSACLCQILCGDISPETLMPPDPLEIDEIYQVLGRDILRSSLLDDIDLYLECDEDSLYVVPHETLPSNPSQLAQLQFASRVRISFPPSCQQVTHERVACTQCSRSFTRKSLLKDHLFRCHGVKDLFPCNKCSYVGQRHRLLQKHMKRLHPSHLQQKPKIHHQQQHGQAGQQPTLIRTHSDLNKQQNLPPIDPLTDTSPVSCTIQIMGIADSTAFRTSDLPSARLHCNISNHSQTTDSCSSSETACSSSNISKHFITECARTSVTHPNELIRTCEPVVADLTKSTMQRRKTKVYAAAGSGDVECMKISKCSAVFQCDQCHKVFKQRRSYNSHMKKHAGLLTYACTECHKQLPSKDTLFKHTKTHQALRRHGCQHTGCAKTFKTRYALKEHMTVVHGTKSWRCSHVGCDKAYATQKDLRSHAVVHTCTHECTECGKTFRDGYNLATHYYVHSGGKNMACTLCDYKCVQKSSLNWHMKKKHLAS